MRHWFSARRLVVAAAIAASVAVNVSGARAQQQGRGGQGAAAQPPRTPRTMAPVDFTGYWAAAITEDWRFRMVTPPKGDYASVPLNADGVKAADAWDRDKDIAAGEQCKPFGAVGIMRMPVRLHVTWQEDTTLKMDIDNGQQTRLFHFDPATPQPTQAEWQGFSIAQWESVQQGQGIAPASGGQGGNVGRGLVGPPLSGSLRIVTTKMRPGYIRRNGVPYSAHATLTEFLDRTTEPNGDSWLILTSVLDDPIYLQMPFMLTTHYKREPDGSKFNPRPCELTPPITGVGQ